MLSYEALEQQIRRRSLDPSQGKRTEPTHRPLASFEFKLAGDLCSNTRIGITGFYVPRRTIQLILLGLAEHSPDWFPFWYRYWY